jgi:hypothetical protein
MCVCVRLYSCLSSITLGLYVRVCPAIHVYLTITLGLYVCVCPAILMFIYYNVGVVCVCVSGYTHVYLL